MEEENKKPMLSKDAFVFFCEKIDKQREKEEAFGKEFDEVLKKYGRNSFNGYASNDLFERSSEFLIDMLTELMDDKQDEWINWWFYEPRYFGDEAKVFDVDSGEEIVLKDAGELYDFLWG